MLNADGSIESALADRYRLDRELGTGGSATVYLAHDLRHRRQVAVKVLHKDLARVFGPERFQREIETTANLRHPHILPLFDSGEAAGTMYYVMPLVIGESLRAMMDRVGRFDVSSALKMIGDIADALHYAHEAGVVHRDIKPENILVENGRAVVADFGIARPSGAAGYERLTSTGMSLGTPLYMSPEQAFGEETLDARSDQYSLTCVLYEMLAGEPPFTGANAMAILVKHMQHAAPRLRDIRPEVPEHLSMAVDRALSKRPEDRFSSIEAWLAALMKPEASPSPAPKTQAGDAARIAVLPFTNMSADPDAAFFGDGMAEEILNELSKLSGLRLIPRTSSFALKAEGAGIGAMAARLGARYVLDGSVRKAGQRMRITVQLIDAAREDTIWSERYDREMVDVFAVQDEITASVRDALSERLLGISIPAARVTPEIDPATYELYLRARYRLSRRVEDVGRGIEALNEVIRRAPRYAPAINLLATAHKVRVIYGLTTPAEGWPLVQQVAERALEADPQSAAAYLNLAGAAFYWEWNWPKARALFDRALALDPHDGDLHANYAIFLCSTRQFDAALRHASLAAATDPLNPSLLLQQAIVQYVARRFDDAMATCERMKELVPEAAEAYRWKGLCLLALGRPADALPEIETAVALSRRNLWALYNYGVVLGELGRKDEAREAAQELEQRAMAEEYTAWVRILAPLLEEPPNLDRVFELLEHAVRVQRSFWLCMLDVEPVFDFLRGDPRFGALVHEVGVPGAASRLPEPPA